MNRLTKYVVASLTIVPSMAMAQGSQTIYKSIDENGHVTYANSPIKGGAKLNLEPLTVIQSSPTAATNSPPAARAITVAKVTSVPSPSSLANTNAMPVAVTATQTTTQPATQTVVPTAVAGPQLTLASLDTSNKSLEQAQQRRAETRRRSLLGEMQAQEKSLVAARSALADEQRRSSDVRMMRASFAATAVAVTPSKPLISPEARAEIERHFERVRNLQDEVTTHESALAALREELVTGK